MFYAGTLQQGISSAVGQQKVVLCFVTDENEESQTWENEFLKDDLLKEGISNHAVALRLKAGSEEAGYLSQIFPLPKTPTVVIIKNGDLKEYLTPPVTKEDFIRRVNGSLSASSLATRPVTTQAPSPGTTPTRPDTAPAAAGQGTQTSDNVRRVLAERAARLQAQKDKAERKAKEDRAKAAEKAKAEAEAGEKTDAASTHRQAELVKKKRQQDLDERKRILQRIEDDKTARKEKAAERERLRVEGQKTGDVAAALVNAPETKLPSTSRLSDMTAVQVRLFDGSTMRTRFKTTGSLKDVRTWVDEKRHDGKLPYTFKQVLTPLPNKSIDATEEQKSLGDLDLAPSATLVLVPVAKFSSAYEENPGIVSRILGLIIGLLSWLLSLIGLGERQDPQPTAAASSPTSGQEARDTERRRRDHQLYNGNSLNFEPRPEEEET